MTRLEPCPACQRHVKVTETACPFCAASLADAFATLAPRVVPRARLGRAAMFAAGVMASQSACGDNIKPHADAVIIPAVDAQPDSDIDAPQGMPIYSAAPTDATGPKSG